MPRGDKSKYTDKQERKAEHIEASYEKRGVPKKGGRSARVGDGQQGRWRRQEARRIGARQDHRTSRREEGRQEGWRCVRCAPGDCAQGIREEGGGHAQASRNIIYRPFGGITWMLECTAALPSAVTLRSVVLMKRPIGDSACVPLLSGP